MRTLRLLTASLIFIGSLSLIVFGTSLQDSEIARLQGPPAAHTPTGDADSPEPEPIHTTTPELTGVDTVAPQILSLVLETAQVDTTASSQMLTITARITDDLSGMRLAAVRFVPAVGGTQYVDFQIQPDLRISGDGRDGVYVAEALLPKYAVHGRWILGGIALSDNANNSIEVLGPMDSSGKAVAQPYFVNGEDSGSPVATPVDPSEPSEGDAAADATPWADRIFMPMLGE